MQVHLFGVCGSYPGPRGSQECRWVQTWQTTYIQGQPLHWLWQVSLQCLMRNTAAVVVVIFETRKLILLTLFFTGTWTSVMSGKLRRSSLSKTLWAIFIILISTEKNPAKILLAPLILCVCLFREICVTGLRTPTVVTSTVWSMKLERGRPFSITMPRTPS